MPWSASDAASHNAKCKDDPELAAAWAKAANDALEEYGDDGKAIATANATVNKMSKSKRDDENNRDLDMTDVLYREQPFVFAANSYDAKSRTCEAVVSVGKRVRRSDPWTGEQWDEVLDMRPTSIRLDRMNKGAQLLDSHNYWGGLKNVLGAVVPGSARIENGELRAKFKFSRSEGGARVAQDLADGIPLMLSAGYKTHREETDRNTSPETRIATDWEPLEVSVVPVAAEAGDTGFRSRPISQHRQQEALMPNLNNGGNGALSDEQVEKIRAEERARIAEETKKRQEAEAAAAAEQKRKEEAAAAEAKKRDDELAKAREAEATRIREFYSAARQAGFDNEHADKALDAKLNIDAYRKQLLEDQAKRTSQFGVTSTTHAPDAMSGSVRLSGGNFVVGKDLARDGFEDAASEALATKILAARRGVPSILNEAHAARLKELGIADGVAAARRVVDGLDKPRIERVREFMPLSMIEIAAMCVGWRGPILPRNVDEIMARAYSVRAGLHALGDFPSIFENAMHKTLLPRYALVQPTYRQLALQRTFSDFRPHPQYRMGDFPTLQALTENGEIKFGTTKESKETISLQAYGIRIGFSRIMMINDDLGAIDELIGQAAVNIGTFENDLFFALLLSGVGGVGPTLNDDGVAVFNAASHNNLASPGGNPSVKTLDAARQAIRGMTNISGKVLNLVPSIILAGPKKETTIDQLLASITPNLISSVNPFAGKLTHIQDANITGEQWYIMTMPSACPCFVYGYLAGQAGPRVSTQQAWSYQGMEVKVEHDFGTGAVDYRGVYKNEGVGPSGEGY